MIRKYSILIFLFLNCNTFLFSQVHGQPGPPVFTYVTVDITDGKAVVHWIPSDSAFVKGYWIFEPIGDGSPGWKQKDTAWGWQTTSLKIDRSEAYHHAEQYKIAAFDTDRVQSSLAPLVGYHSTMYSFPYFDKCSASTKLVWSPYIGWDTIAYYKVFYKLENAAYALLTQLPRDSVSFTHMNLSSNMQYCYYVEAHHRSGYVSMSNQTCVVTKTTVVPDYLLADYASVTGETQLTVSFSFDTKTETVADMTEYKLYRNSSIDGTYYKIATFPKTLISPLIYIDNDLNLSNIYSYKLVANDVCLKDVKESNIASNIYLSVKSENDLSEVLDWTPYKDFPGNIKNYEVYRVVDSYSKDLVASVNFLINPTYTDNTTLFTYNHIQAAQNVSGRFCYYIEAVEDKAFNPLNAEGRSRSNIACAEQKPRIFVPNCIYPNSTVEKNRVFLPHVTFVEKDFILIIYNRWGEKIYETNNPFTGWDAKMKGGEYAPFGTYVYYLSFITTGNYPVEKSGEFLIIYP